MANRARRREPAARKEEILRATIEQIERRGFENARVTDVANALGISPALVFYHFASKNRLFADAFAYASERDLDRLQRGLSRGGVARERLRAVLALYSPSGSSAPGWTLWIDAWAAALRSPELRDVSRRLDLRWKEAVESVIVEGVAAGEFSCPDPHAAAWRITALLDGLAIQVTVHQGVLTTRQMEEWVRAQAEHELGLQPGGLA